MRRPSTPVRCIAPSTVQALIEQVADTASLTVPILFHLLEDEFIGRQGCECHRSSCDLSVIVPCTTQTPNPRPNAAGGGDGAGPGGLTATGSHCYQHRRP